MQFSVVVIDSHDVCPHTLNCQPFSYPADLLSFWDELEVAKQVRCVGHAPRCMVIDSYGIGVGVEVQVLLEGGVHCATERSESWRRPTRAAKTTEEAFNATTNPEGGHGDGDEVSPYLFCPFTSLRSQSDSWFLVSLDFLARNRPMCPLEEPGRACPEDTKGVLVLGDGLDEKTDNSWKI